MQLQELIPQDPDCSYLYNDDADRPCWHEEMLFVSVYINQTSPVWHIPSAMPDDFDLESLVHLEQTFYEAGYEDGFSHGRIHGLIEGRALGRAKGFEMWEELGFYEGFSSMWKDIHSQQGRNDDRSANHIRHLLGLISQFPRINPSASDISSELDIPKLFRQIRSRYKALCSTLGVRPTLQYSERSQDRDERNESSLVIGDSRTEAQSVQNSEAQRPKNSQSLDF